MPLDHASTQRRQDKKQLAVLVSVLAAGAAVAQSFQVLPAPPGESTAVALRVIREAEHPLPHGGTRQSSSEPIDPRGLLEQGELPGVLDSEELRAVTDVAMKCSAARAIGVKGAC